MVSGELPVGDLEIHTSGILTLKLGFRPELNIYNALFFLMLLVVYGVTAGDGSPLTGGSAVFDVTADFFHEKICKIWVKVGRTRF